MFIDNIFSVNNGIRIVNGQGRDVVEITQPTGTNVNIIHLESRTTVVLKNKTTLSRVM